MRTGTPIEMLTLFLLHLERSLAGKNNNVIPDTINIDRLALVLDSKKVFYVHNPSVYDYQLRAKEKLDGALVDQHPPGADNLRVRVHAVALAQFKS